MIHLHLHTFTSHLSFRGLLDSLLFDPYICWHAPVLSGDGAWSIHFYWRAGSVEAGPHVQR